MSTGRRVVDARMVLLQIAGAAVRSTRARPEEGAAMLHMVVNTHNAESCAFRGKDEEELLAGGFDRLTEVATEAGLAIQGWWVNRAAHEVFVLVDAPGGHAVEDVLLAAGLVGRTHSRIMPVVPVERAMED